MGLLDFQIGFLDLLIHDGGLNSDSFILFLAMLNNGKVGNTSMCSVCGSLAEEESRAHPDIAEAEGVVLLDDLAVNKGHKEQGGEESETKSGAETDTGNESWGLLVETESWGALVDDGKSADGAGNQEEEGRGKDGNLDGVFANVDSL